MPPHPRCTATSVAKYLAFVIKSVVLPLLCSIKNDFSAQLHKLLASLTDTRWKLDGKTLLYVPEEDVREDEEEAAKDKDLIQRLESQSVFFTPPLRQKRKRKKKKQQQQQK